MAFPTTVLPITAELFLGGTWVDITSDVRGADGIRINRGRGEGSRTPAPSTCSLTLDNSTGNYAPRNPMGAYYGDIGRNTPLRIGLVDTKDLFARTVSNGWGSTPESYAWSTTGLGGTVQASDFGVGSGVGTHSVPAANAYRMTYLAGFSARDVDVRVDVTLPFSNVTGAAVEPANIAVRGQSTSDYYIARVSITTAEAVTIGLQHQTTGTEIAAAVTVAGLTHTSSQALRVRVQVEGATMRAKVWAATGSEPYDWHVTGRVPDEDVLPGWVGVRSGVASGNTNTSPVVFSYDNFVVSSPRFSGEVASWPVAWDVSGRDATVTIEAAGIKRRLSQGSSPLQSALRRGILSLTTPAVAYWPCEDEDGATEFGSVVPGVGPLVIDGTPAVSSDSTFDCSLPLPRLDLSRWGAYIPAYDNPDQAVQTSCLLFVPAAGDNDGVVMRVHTSGTAAIWDVVYEDTSSGRFRLNVYDADSVLLLTEFAGGFNANGTPMWVSLQLNQSGSDVFYTLFTLVVGEDFGLIFDGTVTSRTLGDATAILINPFHTMDDVVIGHVMVQAEITTLFALNNQLKAWAGETAHARIIRLCGESGVSVDYEETVAAETDPLMGPQTAASLLDLLEECAVVGQGTLHEPRGTVGLAWRRVQSLYNQPATATIDQSAYQLAHPFAPVDDDQATRNDVTVTRTGGSEARAVLETGRMSVLDPADGGVGRYDTSERINAYRDDQLGDLAGWLLLLGTVDEPRFPQINVNRARSQVVADAALSRALLDTSIDDRIVITGLSAKGLYGEVSQLARGYTETMSNFQHTFAFRCAPETPFQVIRLDDTVSKLDSNASYLNAGVNSSATSLSVRVEDGVLWTTSAGQMPISITVGGEEMSVTAISGASSPQTFTVTRSVNGVVKAHSADAQVRLTRRATLAL